MSGPSAGAARPIVASLSISSFPHGPSWAGPAS
jgi:hypothetical protein